MDDTKVVQRLYPNIHMEAKILLDLNREELGDLGGACEKAHSPILLQAYYHLITLVLG